MNRTDRLMAILLELQARRFTRAEDLAAQFEVSVRTIYRDTLAMCEAGVPVVSTPGYGYSLAPGYFLPPLMLTPDEAGMLLLGAAFVAEQVDAPYKQAVETARKKIEKLLPEATRQEVDFLRNSMRFIGRRNNSSQVEERLTLVRRAIADREVIHLRYHARHGEPGERDVEPHGLVCVDGRWVLGAYCRARQAMRAFRLDRIDEARRTGIEFTRRQGYTVQTLPVRRFGPQEVRVVFSPDIVRWAREDLPPGFVHEEQHPDGVLMLIRPQDPNDIVQWLLSWGPGVKVLAPTELSKRMREAGAATLALYPEDDEQGPLPANGERPLERIMP